MSGRIPRRVDSATKAGLLELVDRAVKDGWTHRGACQTLELPERRAWRWRTRRSTDRLADRPVGGNPVHGLLEWEQAEVVALFNDWGEVDRSHRKLAHRGSYLGRVWVSPSSVLRVLAAHGLTLRRPKRAGSSQRKPFPAWVTYAKHSIWIYDTTHFRSCDGIAVTVVMDLVTRKWLATIVSAEETSTQVQVVFTDALESEGLLDEALERGADGLIDPTVDDERRPILLAVSDNGPQMTSGSTREFMVMCAIAQHFGRPHTPTDQGWIETLFGHIKGEWPHLDAIDDPAVLRAELERVRAHYNTVRLHEGIGYVTPDDEHEGRGPAIRQARRDGLRRARGERISYHRTHVSIRFCRVFWGWAGRFLGLFGVVRARLRSARGGG
ncbi:MAG: transposase, partial [Pseudonocardiaceae bacterium]